MRRPKDIVRYARELRHELNTRDPYKIAEYFGIVVIHTESVSSDFTAHTIRNENYPTFISINNRYSDQAKRVLCAHELGHALMHTEGVNNFATTQNNIYTNVEYEANLFAIALLTDEMWEYNLGIPLLSLNNYLLKAIIDYNLN